MRYQEEGLRPLRALRLPAQSCCGLPCPVIPQEASYALKRVERESPPRTQQPDLACTLLLPSSLETYSARHWTGHPHSGQINSLLPWGERALGVPGWHSPVVSNLPRGEGGSVKGQDESGGAPPRKEAARGHCAAGRKPGAGSLPCTVNFPL